MNLPYLLGAWLFILACAFANGALREIVLVPRLGPPWAQLTSGTLLMLVIGAVSVHAVRRLPPLEPIRFLPIGLLWLTLTLAFEFGFGRYAQGKSWDQLFAAYRFTDGNLWPIVLLVVLCGPMAAAMWDGMRNE
jgi:hypothetical protein